MKKDNDFHPGKQGGARTLPYKKNGVLAGAIIGEGDRKS